MFVTILHSVFRENAGTSVAGNNLAVPEGASDDDTAKGGQRFSAFAALGIEETGADEDEDFGGLMVSRRCPNSTTQSQVLMESLVCIKSIVKEKQEGKEEE